MIRRLVVPILAAAALAGCVTGYGYRAGSGDYYYDQPSVEYRYYGDGAPYGGVGYGYPGGWYGSLGYGYGAYPYRGPYRSCYGCAYRYGGYGYGYGYPYYPHYRHRRPPVVVRPHQIHGGNQPPIPVVPDPPRLNSGGDNDGGPWRNLDDIRRQRVQTPDRIRTIRPEQVRAPAAPPAPSAQNRPAFRGEGRGERRMEMRERELGRELTP